MVVLGVVYLTRIVRLDPANIDINVIEMCANVIRSGGIVAFPTETVYGLGADAFNPRAVLKIFKAKNRPPDNPLIIHIASLDQLHSVAVDIPELAWKLIERVWPGPLTLILRRRRSVPREVTGGLDTVAVRMPAHPVALKLIELSRTPIAAPSANLSGTPSPTTAQHVIDDLYGRVDVIIDAGRTLFGVESTIINVLTDPPTLLRPGPITVEQIKSILGIDIRVPEFAKGIVESNVALSPGVKYKHYAPKTPIVLVELEDYTNIQRLALIVRRVALDHAKSGKRVVILASKETEKYYKGFNVIVLGSRSNLYEVARNLFETLRKLDKLGVDIAVAEGYENKGLGLTIMNRLRKASGPNIVKA